MLMLLLTIVGEKVEPSLLGLFVVGPRVGLSVGRSVLGPRVGLSVGRSVLGFRVGLSVGTVDGDLVSEEGLELVGEVGLSVGRSVVGF